jgi:SPP1 gp7 family putative phage head morphogenesis protein
VNNHEHIYDASCKICNAIDTGPAFNLFSEDEIINLLNRIYFGLVSVSALDTKLYHKTAEKLMEAVFDGFDKDFDAIGLKYGTPDFEMLTAFRENVYVFSAAKDYQQTKLMSSLLKDGERLRPFNEFKTLAKAEFEKFNENYLQAEYQSAVAQGRAASLWQTIEQDADLYDQLEYHTVGDLRVRPQHKILNGIIKHVNDPWWNSFFPPLDWRCRCTVIQVSGEKVTNTSKLKISEHDVPELFRFNAGKSKQIFSPAHPYFDVAKEDKQLARNNFNLPLPK